MSNVTNIEYKFVFIGCFDAVEDFQALIVPMRMAFVQTLVLAIQILRRSKARESSDKLIEKLNSFISVHFRLSIRLFVSFPPQDSVPS